MFTERDVFLWLKRPTITNIKAVLEWAQKRALREDIRYKDHGGVDAYPSDMKFVDILHHVTDRLNCSLGLLCVKA